MFVQNVENQVCIIFRICVTLSNHHNLHVETITQSAISPIVSLPFTVNIMQPLLFIYYFFCEYKFYEDELICESDIPPENYCLEALIDFQEDSSFFAREKWIYKYQRKLTSLKFENDRVDITCPKLQLELSVTSERN